MKRLTNLLTIMLHVPSSKITLQLTFILKYNCKYPTRTPKINKKGTIRASLLPLTTS